MPRTGTEDHTVSPPNGKNADRAPSSDAILDAVPDMMFCLDRDGRYLQFKPAKGQDPFVPPEEFLGRTMREILPEDVADEGLAVIQRALDTGEAQAYDYELLEEEAQRRYEARIVPMGPDQVLAIVRTLKPAATHNASAAQRYALTKRELAVLQAVAGGHTDKEVARQLQISPLTVRKHVASIRKKMGAQSRTEASVRALKDGLLS